MAKQEYSKPPYPRRTYLQPKASAEFKKQVAPTLLAGAVAAVLLLAIAGLFVLSRSNYSASLTGFSLAAPEFAGGKNSPQKLEVPLSSVFFSSPAGGAGAVQDYAPELLEKNDGQLAALSMQGGIEYADFSFQPANHALGENALEGLRLVVTWKTSEGGNVLAEIQANGGEWRKACTAEIVDLFSTYSCDLSEFAWHYRNSGAPLEVRAYFASEKTVSILVDKSSLEARLN